MKETTALTKHCDWTRGGASNFESHSASLVLRTLTDTEPDGATRRGCRAAGDH